MKIYYGIKKAMSQVWTKSGRRLPVTVIKVEPVVVTQLKNAETDGYSAVQIGIGARRAKTITKPVAGHLKNSGTTPAHLREVRVSDDSGEFKVGDKISVDQIIKVGDIVKVTGSTKGRGFAGPMKRWGFKGGPKTHGQSDRWRAPGSIGQGTTPGRVLKGRHMAGRYGQENFEITNLQVVKIDPNQNELWVNGPVPGSRDSVLAIEVTKEGQFEGLIQEEAAQTTES